MMVGGYGNAVVVEENPRFTCFDASKGQVGGVEQGLAGVKGGGAYDGGILRVNENVGSKWFAVDASSPARSVVWEA